MKHTIQVLGLSICFLGSAIYLALDANSTQLDEIAASEQPKTGGPLFMAPPQLVSGQQAILQRLADTEKAIYDTMNLLVNELKTMPRAAELAEQLQRLINDYVELATKVIKENPSTQPAIGPGH